jgi:hypothetical protein
LTPRRRQPFLDEGHESDAFVSLHTCLNPDCSNPGTRKCHIIEL